MKRCLTPLVLVCLLFLAAPARAASNPTDAFAFGIELCPESLCGSAIFTGILSGTVAGIDTRLGSFSVAVKHDPLQEDKGDVTAITGGVFQLRAGLRTVRGTIVDGLLISNGDNTFDVTMELVSSNGQLFLFQGTLSHNSFPPTIFGHIVSLN
ncbi:MAG TPA: hypothetical protein VL484_03095 [Vicinamibacterales bacterium]|jgi:hypothetical protein|nr:hypothetical protein [Vicinamibacterales bacterium]